MQSTAHSAVHRNRGRVVRTLVLCGLLGLALALTPASASAQAPTAPTLTGEVLFDVMSSEISGACNPDGSGTIDFSASGPITFGPYSPGSFTAQGRVVLGTEPFGGPFGRVITSITETFTINSVTGNVVGEKSGPLPPPGPVPFGACEAPAAPGVVTNPADSTARYSAVITRPTGDQFVDRGTSEVHIFGQRGPGAFELGTFDERFASQFATAQPCDKFKDKPGTDKDKCKDKK
jgi:hypothetical protein